MKVKKGEFMRFKNLTFILIAILLANSFMINAMKIKYAEIRYPEEFSRITEILKGAENNPEEEKRGESIVAALGEFSERDDYIQMMENIIGN